ncbi:hypothetical protein ACTXT7_015422 [Hymenolepis weldensis]
MELRDEGGNIALWNRAELEWSLNFARQEDCDFTETSGEIRDHDESEDIDEEGYIETQVPEEFKMRHALTKRSKKENPFTKHKSISRTRFEKTVAVEGTQLDAGTFKEEIKSVRFRARLKTVLTLLQGGADPNIRSQGLPPLIAAVRARDLELVKLLLYFKADTNIKTPDIGHFNKKQHIHTVDKSKLTNKCGQVYNASQNGLTPLHFAVVIEGNKGIEMTRILLENGADPNLRADPDGSFFIQFESLKTKFMKSKYDGGRMALHLACARIYDKKNSLKIIRMLMERGSDPNLLCNGQSALSLAVITANDEAMLFLLNCQKTKPDLTLSHGLGSSLCLLLHPMFEHIRSHEKRLQLLKQLIYRTSHGLMGHHVIIPNQMTEGIKLVL